MATIKQIINSLSSKLHYCNIIIQFYTHDRFVFSTGVRFSNELQSLNIKILLWNCLRIVAKCLKSQVNVMFVLIWFLHANISLNQWWPVANPLDPRDCFYLLFIKIQKSDLLVQLKHFNMSSALYRHRSWKPHEINWPRQPDFLCHLVRTRVYKTWRVSTTIDVNSLVPGIFYLATPEFHGIPWNITWKSSQGKMA